MKAINENQAKVEYLAGQPLATPEMLEDLWRNCMATPAMPAINSVELALPRGAKRLWGFDYGASRTDEEFDRLVNPGCKIIEAFAPDIRPIVIIPPHKPFTLSSFSPGYDGTTRWAPFVAFNSYLGDSVKSLKRARGIIDAAHHVRGRVFAEWNGRETFVLGSTVRHGRRLLVAHRSTGQYDYPIGFGWLRRSAFFRDWVAASKFLLAIGVTERLPNRSWDIPRLENKEESCAAVVVKRQALPAVRTFMKEFPDVQLIERVES